MRVPSETVSPNHMASRLPDRLPVGATYVVEGFGGDEGNFRVIARYIVFPGGYRINVPADLSSPPAARVLAFQRRASTKKSDPKNRTGRGSKKIAARRGTG
jgi:hypothetical protein